ncbi:MAG TPA: hypothetical protein VMH83_11270 [Candidatus Acidoferrum sp.]|nr:hypothetical protein [Candidatus Acidoferrum sp.]
MQFASGANSNAPIQRATLVDGNPGSYTNQWNKEVAGLSAWAYLDPGNPQHGSGPADSALHDSMADLSGLGYRSMIKGHLINGQLGGPGIAQNLFPITSQANTKHKNFAENVVKSEVMKRKHTGMGIYYHVEVTDSARSSASPSAAFTCEAYEWNVSGGHNSSAVNTKNPVLRPLDIESHPAQGSTGHGTAVPLTVGVDAFGNKFKHKDYEPTSMRFYNSQLDPGWGEIGSGMGSGGRSWGHLGSNFS